MTAGPRIEDFSLYLSHERRYSPHTVTAYISDVRQFFAFEATQNRPDNEAPDSRMIKAWLAGLRSAGMSAAAVNRKRMALNAYYTYLLGLGAIERNPAKGIGAVKKPARVVHWVSEDKMAALLQDFDSAESPPESHLAARDKALIILLYGCGLRRAEVIGLNVADFNAECTEVKVTGKRNKQRILPLTRPMAQAMRDYLAQRASFLPASVAGNEAAFLLADSGARMYPVFVARRVAHYLQRIPALGRHNPHLLRHSFATNLLNNGASINDIKELLGHAGLASTQVYTHAGIEQLKKQYMQAHPLGGE